MGRVICIGLDGGTFDLIEPWMEAGYLPALREIAEQGVSARLRSVILPFTPQAWTSFMTGVNPGIHGIFGFKEMRKGDYGFQFVNNRSIRVKTLPRLLDELKKRVISVNIPMTYPPDPLNGVIVAGMDAPGVESNFVYPLEMRERILEISPGYTVHLHIGAGYLDSDRKRRAGIRGLLDMVENRERVVLHLLKEHPWDFFAVNFAATDQVQHHFWRYLGGDGEFNDAILSVYRRVDAAVGRIRDRLDDQTSLIVMSDHGAGPASEWVFFIDEWLREQGYLHFASRSPAKRLLSGTVRLGLNALSRKLPSSTKDRLMRRFPGLRTRSQGFIRRSLIDWSRTRVFSGEHPATLRINLRSREPHGIVNPGTEERQLRDRLISDLAELTIPTTGERLVEGVYPKEALYHGPYRDRAPDLMVLTAGLGHQIRGGPYPAGLAYDQTICRKNPHEFFVNGVHRLHGLFMAAGPHVVSRADPDGPFSIMDLCPTVFFMMGLDVPLGLDGRVLEGIFDKDHLRENPVKYRDYDLTRTGEAREKSYDRMEDAQKIETVLRGLGYLD